MAKTSASAVEVSLEFDTAHNTSLEKTHLYIKRVEKAGRTRHDHIKGMEVKCKERNDLKQENKHLKQEIKDVKTTKDQEVMQANEQTRLANQVAELLRHQLRELRSLQTVKAEDGAACAERSDGHTHPSTPSSLPGADVDHLSITDLINSVGREEDSVADQLAELATTGATVSHGRIEDTAVLSTRVDSSSIDAVQAEEILSSPHSSSHISPALPFEHFEGYRKACALQAWLSKIDMPALLEEIRQVQNNCSEDSRFVSKYAFLYRSALTTQADADVLTPDELRKISQTDQPTKIFLDNASRNHLLRQGWSNNPIVNDNQLRVGDVVVYKVREKLQDDNMCPDDPNYMSSGSDIDIVKSYPGILTKDLDFGGWEILRVRTRRGKGREGMDAVDLNYTARVISRSTDPNIPGTPWTTDDCVGIGPIEINGNWQPANGAFVDTRRKDNVFSNQVLWRISARLND
ncbi:hypothetical protein LTR97_004746 [Elasticomyces elasticus]|uniref:Uncharacterized protein n=1 Tax=Elasticomyces elasticus TaxID=574655 RepID=A0AAN7VTX2_9PEZI|nr:hypothetical protein LTR97_004746 [Elasticomyces elasticus]